MKRIWSLLLACCLLLSALWALSACEDEKDNGDSDKPPVPTVSVMEWIKAFDLSDLRSFTVSITERDGAAEDGAESVSCTLKYRDGVATIELCEREGASAEERETCYFKTEIEDLVDLDMDILEEIAFALEDRADYGYSSFSYSEETKSYHAKLGLTPFENERIEIGFENGNIVKILFEASGEYEGMTVEAYSLTEFTKINKTERITMPTKQAEDALALARESILSAQSYMAHGCSGYSDAEILRAFYYFLEELDFESITFYSTSDDGWIGMEFDCDRLNMSFMGKTVYCDSMEINIRNGRISSIYIGDYISIFGIEY